MAMSGQKCCCFTLMTGVLLICLSLPAVPAALWRDRPEVRDLIVTDAALERMRGEYTAMRATDVLNGLQRREFEIYLQQLAQRIAHQCRQLQILYPDIQLTELPCPVQVQQAGGSLPEEIADERTAGETIAVLDAALAGELAEFDEMLLREQQRAVSRVPRARATSREQATGYGTGRKSGSRADAQAQSETDSTVLNSAGGGERQSSTERPAEHVPEGSGDDVVARQLREAAEKERDPALKKKLWEEYRRYKASIH